MLAPHTPKQSDLLAAPPAADCEPDRAKPEARVCERHAVVERESDRLPLRKPSFVDPLL